MLSPKITMWLMHHKHKEKKKHSRRKEQLKIVLAVRITCLEKHNKVSGNKDKPLSFQQQKSTECRDKLKKEIWM